MFFQNTQRQMPDMWIKQRGPANARQTQVRYNLRTENEAITLLNNLVREKRLVRKEVDGVMVWDIPRRVPRPVG